MNSATPIISQWQPLMPIDTGIFRAAREQLHHAAQPVSVLARCLLPAREDDSHTNFEWLADVQALATERLDAASRLRAAIRPRDMNLLLLSGEKQIVNRYALAGKNLTQALSWLKTQGAVHGFDTAAVSLKTPYEIPEHPITAGRPFALDDAAAFVQLGHLYHNADLLLRALARDLKIAASPVRCWPHHFDIATLITIEAHEDPERAKSIGAGMTPGDGSYNDPYFYVSPWPYPNRDNPELPALKGGGHWHTEGWFGAVLSISDIDLFTPAATQVAQIQDFFNAAVNACRQWLGKL